MKKKNIYISLYVLVPVIYTGISIIGIVLIYQLFHQKVNISQINILYVVYVIAVIAFITFFTSFILLRLLFKPLIQFINKTKKMPIIAKTQIEKQKDVMSDLSQIDEIFDNVTNILSKVEARELFPKIVGSSASMRNIFTQILKVAATDSTVLIFGESGTGKELVASSIYERSSRKDCPFIKINCVAIPEGLLESEFFGHEKGSFTGAIEQKKGKFEIANGGTVFMDEIGDMPLATQAKLLRVLQEKEFERVGGIKPIKVDIRFIAATNKDLPEMIKNGKFREDLYFRLNVFSINLPALRERKEDIALLADYFLSSLPQTAKLSTSALQALIGYSWPGNVRELRNVLEQASILSEKGIIEPQHLPVLFGQDSTNKIDLNDDVPLDDRLNLMEKEIIMEALRKSGGIQVKAAGILGINQRSLWHRVKKLKIDVGTIKNLQ
ncbi:MAG: sigma-54-dependent Fis family transcriptional regulator [Syntrophaceae bacterium]|nr:sigma-54-dependent Fis family transcriptional regulator [Syntrophaceae bacterium]